MYAKGLQKEPEDLKVYECTEKKVVNLKFQCSKCGLDSVAPEDQKCKWWQRRHARLSSQIFLLK